MAPTVFISYSHKDAPWMERVAGHLRVLEHEGLLQVWHDGLIEAGDDWLPAIHAAMSKARVAICLVSAHFLDSKFIRHEEVRELMARRRQEGLRVIPLIVSDCAWQEVGWLSGIQARPPDGTPLRSLRPKQADAVLARLAKETLKLLGGSRTDDRDRVLDLGRLPVPGPHFVGRKNELQRLDAAWEDPAIHVLSLVAFGGVGKSALVSAWLDAMAAGGWRGAERVVDWSFYTQGTEDSTASAELFIDHALRVFGDPDPTAGSPYDRGSRLAGLVGQKRALLILDGLEPLQHGPGPVEGRLKDPGLASFLKGLASANRGLCLLTSRVAVTDLAGFRQTAPRYELGELSLPAAVELLQLLEVKGRTAELEAAVGEFGRQALTLTLLGTYLRRAHDGDIRLRGEVKLGRAVEKQGGHAFRVIEAYARFLGKGAELSVLRLLGLFDHRADTASLAALRASPKVPGLNDRLVEISDEVWRWAVSSLREHNLLAGADPLQPESLDAHPLVRAYFALEMEKHQPKAWRAGNLRLYKHLRMAAPELPDTLEAMQPLYAAVVHGCRAGRHQEALDTVFYRRIQRGERAFSTNTLGAFGGDLTALAGFFEQTWSLPARGLRAASQAFVLTTAGVLLRGLARLRDAVEPTQVAWESAVTREDWLNASCACGNLSDLKLALGDVALAEELGRESVRLADLSGNEAEKRYNLGVLASALHQAGRTSESAAIFREAEALEANPEAAQPTPYYYSVASYEYCDLLLGKAEREAGTAQERLRADEPATSRLGQACHEVIARASRSLQIALENRWLRDAALESLSLGRAHLGLVQIARASGVEHGNAEAALEEATEHLDRAVEWLRRAGQENDLPRGLLARAALRRFRSMFGAAEADLAEALEVAERGFMRLHECDVHLEWTRLCLRQNDAAAGREHLARARKLVEETGYRRREREVVYLANEVGQNKRGIHLGESGQDTSLERAYLGRLMAQTEILPLRGVESAATGSNKDPELKLYAVYTALLTRSARLEPGTGRESRENPVSAVEQLNRHRRLVLLGDPGSGKSTFVNFVALCFAGEALDLPTVNLALLTSPLPNADKPQPWSDRWLLPVRVVLRDFAASGLPAEPGEEATAKCLWAFIERELDRAGHAGFYPTLRQEVLAGRGLVLLDGLDEVTEAHRRREQVRQSVQDFAAGVGTSRVLVTSRTYAYQNQGWRLPGFEEAILAPFTHGQIERFVWRWYEARVAHGKITGEEAEGRGELLRRAIFSSDRLLALAERPLLLTLMASLHASRGGSLPEGREQLYSEAVDLLLNTWESQRLRVDADGSPLVAEPSLAEWLKADRKEVRQVLEKLAFEAHGAQPGSAGTADVDEGELVKRLLHLNQNREADPRQLVAYLRDRSGLLVERGEGVYTFAHRTFQEYLAACFLTEVSFPEKAAELGRAEPGRWREVVLLAGAKAARGTASRVWWLADVLCYLDPPGESAEDEWGALLAGQAVAESADLARIEKAHQPKLERLKRWLVHLMRLERFPVLERAAAGAALAEIGDPRVEVTTVDGMEFCRVAAGPFLMGSEADESNCADDEEPRRKASLTHAFWMGRYPVTVAQFREYVGDSGEQPMDGDSLRGRDNEPVVWVSWLEAVAFCAWLTKRWRKAGRLMEDWEVRLSSEAEWEKAARGGLVVPTRPEISIAGGPPAATNEMSNPLPDRRYPWGDEADRGRSNYSASGLGSVSAVGCFPSGASPYGCEEMSGNVWEWTGSPWLRDRGEARQSPSQILRTLRGGGFYDQPKKISTACREWGDPESGLVDDGFRVVAAPCGSDVV